MKFLALTSDLLATKTLTLISSFPITGCFPKVSLQEFKLVILNFELQSVFSYALCELFKKQAVLCGNNCALVNIRDNLLCIKNHCINICGFYDNNNLTLQFQFLDSRFQFLDFKKTEVSHKTIYHLLRSPKLIPIMLEQHDVIHFGFLHIYQRNNKNVV